MSPAEIALFIVPAIAVGGVVTQVGLSIGTVKQLKEEYTELRRAVEEIRREAAIGNAHLASIDTRAATLDQRVERLERKVWNGGH